MMQNSTSQVLGFPSVLWLPFPASTSPERDQYIHILILVDSMAPTATMISSATSLNGNLTTMKRHNDFTNSLYHHPTTSPHQNSYTTAGWISYMPSMDHGNEPYQVLFANFIKSLRLKNNQRWSRRNITVNVNVTFFRITLKTLLIWIPVIIPITNMRTYRDPWREGSQTCEVTVTRRLRRCIRAGGEHLPELICLLYFQHKLLPSTSWTPFSSQYSAAYSLYNNFGSTGNHSTDINELADQFTELTIGENRRLKRPPASYLCHLCFQKGHYIKDCPKVIANQQCSFV